MKLLEVLKWMCEDITYWYIKDDDKKRVIYPLTLKEQKIVENILNEKADFLIYESNCYKITADISYENGKESFVYYMRRASYYFKRKVESILPYNYDDNEFIKIEKISDYYKKQNIPFFIIMVEEIIDKNIKDMFTYINYKDKKIIKHADIYVYKDNHTYIFTSTNKLLNDLKKNNIEYKRLF